MAKTRFNGEFWNRDRKTDAITRFRFFERGRQHFVAAWGACFPSDCEWGDTKLHILRCDDNRDKSTYGFATWRSSEEPSHCLFQLTKREMIVDWVSLHTDIQSFKMQLVFQQDPARSKEARSFNPLTRFSNMWDGSEQGWKLVRHDTPVFLIDFNFGESGPTKEECDVMMNYIELWPRETKRQLLRRLRGCTGIHLADPFGQTKMKLLKEQQLKTALNLTEYKIGTNDYLVLTPQGSYFGWAGIYTYRKPVIERMLKAGVPIVSRQCD